MSTANTSIHDVLDELTRATTDERGKGDKFERLVQTYLLTDVTFQERFGEVWLWGLGGTPGSTWSPRRTLLGHCQCKFYEEDHALQKTISCN